MSVSRKHSLWGVVAHATAIPAITTLGINTGTQVVGTVTSGGIYRRFQSVVGQAPTAEFGTLAIASALTTLPSTGKSIADLADGLSMYIQKHLIGGTRTAGSTHRKYVATAGIIVPRRLTVSHGGDASLSYDVIVLYDGSNDPLVFTDEVALPEDVGEERFTLGPVSLGDVTLDHLRQFEIDFGLNAVTEGADSEIWDRYVSLETIEPSLTLRGIDPEWVKAANIPLIGKSGTHANSTAYLRKRDHGGTFVADVTAEHVKFTADGLITIEEAASGSGSGAVETSARMDLEYDGTNAPLVVVAASAIT